MTEQELRQLHPLEVKLLMQCIHSTEFNKTDMISVINFSIGQINQATNWLLNRNLITIIAEHEHNTYELTELGKSYHKNGIPESRLFAIVQSSSQAYTLPEIAEMLTLDMKTLGIAYGILLNEKILYMDSNKYIYSTHQAQLSSRIIIQTELLARAYLQDNVLTDSELSAEQIAAITVISKKRGASNTYFKLSQSIQYTFAFTQAAYEVYDQLIKFGITGDELGQVTLEMLEKQTWRGQQFRAYTVNLPPARLIPGRTNAYGQFIDEVKDMLVSMGFQEMDGSIVESDFWNSDALFIPQFHSSRGIRDVYSIADSDMDMSIDAQLIDTIAAIHENGGDSASRGWQYSFNKDFTRRLILRTHGTVLSVKKLRDAINPGKYFGIARCFRYDQIDVTHLSDFYQTDGIIIDNEMNIARLFGMLQLFAQEIAHAQEIRYVPAYFPFTEPSFEIHVKHPKIGWFELGGAGVFRPEVSQAWGFNKPVIAWGLGIDRMALLRLGLTDIRDLFSNNLEEIRLQRLQQKKVMQGVE